MIGARKNGAAEAAPLASLRLAWPSHAMPNHAVPCLAEGV